MPLSTEDAIAWIYLNVAVELPMHEANRSPRRAEGKAAWSQIFDPYKLLGIKMLQPETHPLTWCTAFLLKQSGSPGATAC